MVITLFMSFKLEATNIIKVFGMEGL